MTAIGAGYAEVFANSGRIANTIYMAPDRFGYLLGLTSDAFTQFTTVSQSGVGPLSRRHVPRHGRRCRRRR